MSGKKGEKGGPRVEVEGGGGGREEKGANKAHKGDLFFFVRGEREGREGRRGGEVGEEGDMNFSPTITSDKISMGDEKERGKRRV